jgi:hypothetical protein
VHEGLKNKRKGSEPQHSNKRFARDTTIQQPLESGEIAQDSETETGPQNALGTPYLFPEPVITSSNFLERKRKWERGLGSDCFLRDFWTRKQTSYEMRYCNVEVLSSSSKELPKSLVGIFKKELEGRMDNGAPRKVYNNKD